MVSAVHQAHLKIFHGCVLSKLQIKLKHFPEDLNFFQIAVRRFLARDITPHGSTIIGYVVAGLSLSISILTSLFSRA